MRFISVVALFLFSLVDAHAREPYKAIVNVGSQSATFTTTNVVDLTKDLSTAAIHAKIGGYTSTSAASLTLNLRGLTVTGSYPAGSTTLTVQIPQAGIVVSFSGSTREESNRLFEEFYYTGAHDNRKFRNAFARYTPIDPIAGNPNSLMSLMAQADFAFARLSPLSGCQDCCQKCCEDPNWSSQPLVHQFQVQGIGARAMSETFDTIVLSLPFRYSYSPTKTWALIFDLPFTLLDNDGAWSIDGSLGAGFRIPIVYTWTLTPTVRLGLGCSPSFNTLGSFVSSGLLSNINIPMWNFVLSVADYGGYFYNIPVEWGGIKYNYHLQNWIFKNGIALTTCNELNICGIPFNFGINFTDSLFCGDELFIEHYDEVGFSIIANCLSNLFEYDSLILNASYQFGQKNYQAYVGSLAYQF